MIFFHFDINQHECPTNTPYKISAKYTHFGERDLNAWVDVNFVRVDVNFQTAIVTKVRYTFFFILILINIEVLLILHTKFQPKILSRSGEKGDFNRWRPS